MLQALYAELRLVVCLSTW